MPVEQQQIGRREQQPRQRRPRPLPPAHRGEGLPELRFPELQAGEGPPDLGLVREPSPGLEPLAESAVFLERVREPGLVAVRLRRGEPRLEVRQAPLGRREMGERRRRFVPQRTRLVHGGILRQISGGRPAR